MAYKTGMGANLAGVAGAGLALLVLVGLPLGFLILMVLADG